MMTEAIRVITVSILSFAVALLLTPAVLAVLKKFDFKKQIRTVESAPIYSKLHKAKEGAPTMGGIIIWGTVLGLAAILFLLDALFDGSFTNLTLWIERKRFCR